MECEEAWDSISCIALSRVRAHFHKLVSMVCPGRKMVPAAVHATPRFWFGLVRTPNEKWEELVSTAPGSRLWFGLVRNFGENWEEPGCPRRYIPHQCPDLAPRWDLDGSHLGRCKFKKKSSRVRSICEYCATYLTYFFLASLTVCMALAGTQVMLLNFNQRYYVRWVLVLYESSSDHRDTMSYEYWRVVATMW